MTRSLDRSGRASVAGLLAAAALAGCARAPGFTARLAGGVWHETWSGAARARECATRGVLLLEGDGPGQQGMAVVWYFGDSLHPDSVTLGRPIERGLDSTADSTRSAASSAVRRLVEVTVIGYQSRYGHLRVTRAGSAGVTADIDGVFDRLGVPESLHVTGRFATGPVADDTTLCAIPRGTRDSGVTLTR